MGFWGDPGVYAFVRGPLAAAAFVCFAGGLAYQTVRFWRLTKGAGPARVYADTRPLPPPAAPLPFRIRLGYALIRLRQTTLGREPAAFAVSAVFHACLLAVPLLLTAHNILLDESFGVSLFALSEKTTDVLTLLFMACALFLLARRMLLARVRAVSGPIDAALWVVAFLPFLTGWLAYHQLFDYRTMVVLHICCGELLIAAVPYTRFMHALYFFFVRFCLPGENSFVWGKRVWQT